MYSKRSGQGDGPGPRPVRTSDRLRRRPKVFSRTYLYYTPGIIRSRKGKTKTRTAASRIAKMLGNRAVRAANANVSAHISCSFISLFIKSVCDFFMDIEHASMSVPTNLRRSTRKRRLSAHLEDYTDSSGSEDEDLMVRIYTHASPNFGLHYFQRPAFRPLRNQIHNSVSQDELSSSKRKKTVETKSTPRREGLRPRRSRTIMKKPLAPESGDEQDTSEEKAVQDETENGNDIDDNDADGGQNDNEAEDEGDGDGEGEGEEEGEEDDDDEDDDDEGEEEEEEQDGRRRYDLRNRAEVRRLSMEEGKQRPRSPRRVLHQGMGTKVNRDARKGGSRVHKRHRLSRAEDSDDSLLVDEMDQGPTIPWARGGSRSGPPWLFGGLEMHGTTAWGLNVAASGWGHQGDALASLTSGVQTAGPSSKGGADIQPLQVDDTVSFDDIGGLSGYIDALKEMVFFPLLYPDFFANIHTRKWKHPPSKELKSELAANCVGYCGADLKALCTEAAIHAFREKYPQVYTSDDKFVIDVDSVKVEKYNFVEAMSTITPAAHRGAAVHSRPLSLVVAPCLQSHLQKAMNCLSDIFSPLAVSSEFIKLSMLSYGSAIPLVYRPRLLLCGCEGSGLDHLGPAVLHELEKFPVHSLGLPSLLSDPSAKTPEEALVHIFGEARRATPSILYIPHFDLWWDNAHEQLRAVLLTLLEELPSDLPILLLGSSSSPPAEIDGASSVFPDHSVHLGTKKLSVQACVPLKLSVPPLNRCMAYTGYLQRLCFLVAVISGYQVGKPSTGDRSSFFDCLIEAALSIVLEDVAKKSQGLAPLPELPKAQKVASGPKASELKAKIEAEQHALRRMRMCLRDICNRILYDKRFSAFHYPVTDEDAPNYRSIIQNPMDIATMLQRVDSGQYITCSVFLQDIDLIVTNAKVYNGDDYNGARIVSRGHELRDAVHGMLSQMDPALVTYCDKIAAQGGPVQVPDDLGGSIFPSTPVVQLGTTRTSARLRNVQPDVNLDQSYEALKRQKKNADATHAASAAEDKSRHQDSVQAKPPEEHEADDMNPDIPEPSSADDIRHETSGVEASAHIEGSESQDVAMSDAEVSSHGEYIKRLFIERTENYDIPQLERLYTRIMKGLFETKDKGFEDGPRYSILRFLVKFAEDAANF
ncbi:hypothetical protein SADUNF_Sadunf07G0109800 [Salix dunnii]|uniref:Bromo domain-containing protein n=1 Tax=Salix dunnii TaxID=1413687 RepID=A0A835N2H3_9ROSI|nr:hypothetical protein SADUNF_Sadunf07G0109800 [Salix dunnii]